MIRVYLGEYPGVYCRLDTFKGPRFRISGISSKFKKIQENKRLK